MFDYHATVIKVVDGDTVRLQVDLGFNTHIVDSFRLAGINAPEMSTEAGRKSRLFLDSMIPAGSPVMLRSLKAGPLVREKYGRWLAVLVGGGLKDVNAEMVASGHAVAWDGSGKRPE